jgi:hypothetical protein
MKQHVDGVDSCIYGYIAAAYTGSAVRSEENGSRCLGDADGSRRSAGLIGLLVRLLQIRGD